MIVATLPTEAPAARMRVLRTLESLGAAMMRDGAYLLPETAANRQAAAHLVEFIRTNGGSAQALRASPLDALQDTALRQLFDRSSRYENLIKTIESLKVGFGISDPSSISRVLHKQRREFDDITALDFFASPARERAQSILTAAEAEARALLFPAQAAPGAKTSERFLGRTWSTRRPLWADRLACAWLIRRFVDPEANLVWLEQSQDTPPDALGYAFEGARFANSGNRITFEQMLVQLGMDVNSALVRIGGIVRFLEVREGPRLPEAAGVQTLLQGAVRRSANELELLGEAEKTFDLLYEAYSDPGSV